VGGGVRRKMEEVKERDGKEGGEEIFGRTSEDLFILFFKYSVNDKN